MDIYEKYGFKKENGILVYREKYGEDHQIFPYQDDMDRGIWMRTIAGFHANDHVTVREGRNPINSRKNLDRARRELLEYKDNLFGLSYELCRNKVMNSANLQWPCIEALFTCCEWSGSSMKGIFPNSNYGCKNINFRLEFERAKAKECLDRAAYKFWSYPKVRNMLIDDQKSEEEYGFGFPTKTEILTDADKIDKNFRRLVSAFGIDCNCYPLLDVPIKVRSHNNEKTDFWKTEDAMSNFDAEKVILNIAGKCGLETRQIHIGMVDSYQFYLPEDLTIHFDYMSSLYIENGNEKIIRFARDLKSEETRKSIDIKKNFGEREYSELKARMDRMSDLLAEYYHTI